MNYLATDEMSLAEPLCIGSRNHQTYKSSPYKLQFKISNHTCSWLSIFSYFRSHSVLRFWLLHSSGSSMKVNHESVLTSGDIHNIHLELSFFGSK